MHIPAGIETVIERYSDSASTYVVLDPTNTTVYKQLYRAAKAKSKLKLRVTIKNEKSAPKPVTVEDQPETATEDRPQEIKLEDAPKAVDQEEPQRDLELGAGSAAPAASTSPTTETDGQAAQPLDPRVSQKSHVYPQTRPFCLAGRDIPDYRSHRLGANVHARHQNVMAPPSVARCNPTFAICCNSCETTIPDAHYHCSTCDDGDFDLCESCVANSITCYSSDHWLIKRTMRNGQIVNSTTETIPPKPKAKKEEPKQELPMPRALPLMSRRVIPVLNSSASLPLGSAPATQVKLPSFPQLPQLPLRSKPVYGNARTCNCCVEGQYPSSD